MAHRSIGLLIALLPLCSGWGASATPIFISSESPYFIFHYVQGSAADRDITTIIANRERAYAIIAAALDVPPGDRINITLYPNRESTPSGYGAGSTTKDVVSVNYFDFTPSYEQTRYGHEMTHALSYRLLHGYHSVKFLSEGLAEYLDQSGRNLHEWLSYECRIFGDRTPVRIENADLRGTGHVSYTKAGSFVKFLVETSGWNKFREFYKATQTIGKSLPNDYFQRFADEFKAIYGKRLEDAEADWNKKIDSFRTAELPKLPALDEAAVRALFSSQDAASASGNTQAFLSTYDPLNRRHIPYFTGDVQYYMGHILSTDIVGVYDLGIKNGRRALAYVIRRFTDGRERTIEYFVEKRENGWKITNEEWP